MIIFLNYLVDTLIVFETFEVAKTFVVAKTSNVVENIEESLFENSEYKKDLN